MNKRTCFRSTYLCLSLLFSSFLAGLSQDVRGEPISSSTIKCSCEDIKIGLYSGTFDPPTKAHNAIIRNAIQNLKLERLYIFVNKNGGKQYKCSSEERVAMLKRMLKDIEDKVVIIAQASDSKREDYKMIKNILIKDKVIHIVGEDSYERRLLIIPDKRVQFDAIAIIPREGYPKIENLESNAFYLPINDETMLNVSSTKVRSQLASRDCGNIDLDGNVLSYIIENNLYRANCQSYEDRFLKEYYAYIGQLFCAGELCTPCPPPPYDPYASESSWYERFHRWVTLEHKRPTI